MTTAIIVDSWSVHGSWDGYVAVHATKGLMPPSVSFRTMAGAANWLRRNWPTVTVALPDSTPREETAPC